MAIQDMVIGELLRRRRKKEDLDTYLANIEWLKAQNARQSAIDTAGAHVNAANIAARSAENIANIKAANEMNVLRETGHQKRAIDEATARGLDAESTKSLATADRLNFLKEFEGLKMKAEADSQAATAARTKLLAPYEAAKTRADTFQTQTTTAGDLDKTNVNRQIGAINSGILATGPLTVEGLNSQNPLPSIQQGEAPIVSDAGTFTNIPIRQKDDEGSYAIVEDSNANKVLASLDGSQSVPTNVLSYVGRRALESIPGLGGAIGVIEKGYPYVSSALDMRNSNPASTKQTSSAIPTSAPAKQSPAPVKESKNAVSVAGVTASGDLGQTYNDLVKYFVSKDPNPNQYTGMAASEMAIRIMDKALPIAQSKELAPSYEAKVKGDVVKAAAAHPPKQIEEQISGMSKAIEGLSAYPELQKQLGSILIDMVTRHMNSRFSTGQKKD
jgi:hypothetical protein